MKKLLPWLKKDGDVAVKQIIEGKAEVVAEELHDNANPIVRRGLLALLVGFGGFLVWAAFAPLDAGITAHGVVTVDSKRKTIQHLRGGIVEQILVKEGDKVKKNDVLLRLNKTQAEAQYAVIRAQLITARAVESRLLAERSGAGEIKFHDWLQQSATDSVIKDAMQTQQQLFRTRRETLKGELSIVQQNIAGLEQQLTGLQALEKGKAQQVKLLTEEVNSLRTLFEQGYVPRNRIFELERALAEISAQRSSDIANIGRTQSALSEMRLRGLQRQQEYRKEVETQLTDIQRESDNLQERFVAVEDELARVDVRAPTDGVVVGLNVHTVGGVVNPSEKMMDIIPVGEQLVIEAQVETHMVEKVRPNLPAVVRFSALDKLTPVVDGKVTTVSADRLTDPRTGFPYYLAQVSVPVSEMKKLGGHQQVQPGMPVEVILKTGEHSLLYYLVKPLTDHMFSALKEQ